MRLKLISCDIFERELRATAARSSNRIDLEFLPTPPHQLTDAEMVRSLQVLINRARRTRYQAVLMVAGSCKHGLTGLKAAGLPLVLPRAKDCISLLLEREAVLEPCRKPRPACEAAGIGANGSLNAFWPTVARLPSRLGLRPSRPVLRPKAHSIPDNLESLWAFRMQLGGKDPARSGPSCVSLLEMLVEGYWNYHDFLVVPPGWQVQVNDQQGTMTAEQPWP